MAVKHTLQDDGKTVHIRISGGFDVRDYDDFKAAFVDIRESVLFEVDLSAVRLIDSSGLGLLVHLREHASITHSEVVLLHPSQIAFRSLKRSLFHELFDIRT